MINLDTIASVGTFCSTPEAIADKFLTSMINSFSAATIIPRLNIDLNALSTLFSSTASKPFSGYMIASMSLVKVCGIISL